MKKFTITCDATAGVRYPCCEIDIYAETKDEAVSRFFQKYGSFNKIRSIVEHDQRGIVIKVYDLDNED